MLSQCQNQKFLAWPYLVVAPQMHCHICCVAGIFELSVAYSTNNWMVISLFEAKMHPNFRFVLRRGRRNLGSIFYAVHFVVFWRVPDTTWEKAFKALQKLTRDQNDVVFSGGRLERDKWEVGNIFAARESILRIDSATDDTIRVSLTVAIRFTDASVNRYTPNNISVCWSRPNTFELASVQMETNVLGWSLNELDQYQGQDSVRRSQK